MHHGMGPHIAVARMPIKSEGHRGCQGYRKIAGSCRNVNDVFHLVIDSGGDLNRFPIDGNRALVAGLRQPAAA